ncbi:hypothetical protein BH20ACT24_BH20ACT24_01610 [soil metagenome]
MRTVQGPGRWAAAIALAALVGAGSPAPNSGAADAVHRVDRMAIVARDMAVEAGIYEVTSTFSAAVADYDRDGWLDFLLSRHGDLARLYLNDQAGHFTEINAGAFVQTDRHDCVAGDVDADQRPDIFCSTGAKNGTGLKWNELWMQEPGLDFVDRAPQAGVMDAYGRGRHSTFIDVDRNGSPDLFVGNDPLRLDGLPSPNRLFLNQGEGSFREAPEFGVNEEIGARCASAPDVNGDGWQDLLVCSDSGPRMYRNHRGRRFLDVTSAMGMSGLTDVARAVTADVDGDGRPDLIAVSMTKVQVFLQRAGRFRSVFSRSLTAGVAAAAGDADGDGHLDVYVLQGGRVTNEPDVMLLNDGRGTSFTEIPIPQATEGSGDAVYPLDYDRNGLTDFLVLNGGGAPGPIQLIAFFAGGLPGPDASAFARGPVELDRAGTGAGEVACGPDWKIQSTQVLEGNNSLNGIEPVARDDVWGVGRVTSGGAFRTLGEHRDLSTWTVVPSPNVGGADNSLLAVDGAGPDDVWAVGYSTKGGVEKTLVERWNGSAWTVVESPNVGVGSNLLLGVAAASATDVWAVGRYAESGAYRTLVQHWDGSAWTVVPSPNVGTGSNVLLGVAAASATEVWAVGYARPETTYEPLVERWDGSAWTVVPSPGPGMGEDLLVDVAVRSPTEVWAVGYSSTTFARQTLIERWDGSAWSSVPAPSASQQFNALRGVTATSGPDLWAVGAAYDPALGFFQTLIERWNGAAWTISPSPDPAGDNELLAVASTPDTEVIAAGTAYGSGQSLVERACP